MARKKKTKYIRKSFETRLPGAADSTGEKIVALCLTQLMSDAWANLTGNQRNLYIFMRLRYDGENEHGFYFNKALYMKQYRLYTNGTQFQRDLAGLVENGFVDIVERGWTTRTRNVYAFSDRWQTVKRKKKDMSAANDAKEKV